MCDLTGSHQILIVETPQIIADVLRSVLANRYVITGVLVGRPKVEEQARLLSPDVIVIDAELHGLDEQEVVRNIRRYSPRTGFVFITNAPNPNLATVFLECRSVAVVLKQSSFRELLEAIGHILRGERYLASAVRWTDLIELRLKARRFAKGMSARQREVVSLLVSGHTMKEIGVVLGLSPRTVFFHKVQVMEKFGLKNRTELIRLALKQGLIPAESKPFAEAVTSYANSMPDKKEPRQSS